MTASTVPQNDLSKRRIKVAVLVGALEVGGAELDIVRNFPRLNRSEFEVVVVSFGTRGALASELERQGIPVIARRADESAPRWLLPRRPQAGAEGVRQDQGPSDSTSSASPKAPRRPLRQVLFGVPPLSWVARPIGAALYIARVTLWVGKTLNAEKVDIAHFFLPHSYAYGMFATAFMRPNTKCVMSRLSLNFYKDSHKLIAWLERNLLHQRVDLAIGNSTTILEELIEEGVDPSRVRLLYNGIDPAPLLRHEGDRARARDALGLEADAFVIAAVGNLHTYKGHGDLIEACWRVREQLPERWQLLIAGRDEAGNRAVYEALIAERGLGDHVRLLGACDTVPQLLFAADVFAHPSHHEGLPNAIIEAMAASLPTIGTTVGGIPEVVRSAGDPEETGWLVPPSDPDAMAAALLQAAADPSRRRAMGARARERVEAQFSLERSVSMYESIYRELMFPADD